MVRIYKVWTDERCPDGEEETYIDVETLAERLWTEDDIPEEWFVESVNDIYEPVELGLYHWTPAEVLKKMNPKAWEKDYKDFILMQIAERQDDALEALKKMQPGDQIQENGFTIRCEEPEKKTLMETLVDAGYPADQFDHHESDLYEITLLCVIGAIVAVWLVDRFTGGHTTEKIIQWHPALAALTALTSAVSAVLPSCYFATLNVVLKAVCDGTVTAE